MKDVRKILINLNISSPPVQCDRKQSSKSNIYKKKNPGVKQFIAVLKIYYTV